MKEVAEQYGFEVKKGVMLCPFHNDSHPSLTVYPGNRGWHCFVCNDGGSVIDFVAKLFSINVRQAVLRLDNDFHLGLSTQRPPVRRDANRWAEERKKKQAELETHRAEYTAKIEEFRSLWHMTPPSQEIPQDSPLWGEYAAKLGRREYLDYWIDNTEWR